MGQAIGGLTTTNAVQYFQQLQNAQMNFQPLVNVKRVDAPKVADLARTTLVAVEPSEQVAVERVNLAAKARRLLGYKVLGERIDKDERAKQSRWECAQAFEKLGFDPLDADKVKAYQSQMVASKGHMVKWEKTPLEKYAEAVPEFALSRAIELKEELPAATFEVEFLHAVPDPFLILVYGSERFYIDVWDEPLFEGRRTV